MELAGILEFPNAKREARATARPSRCEVKPAWRLNAKQDIGGISHG